MGTRGTFDRELTQLRESVLAMGSQVQRAIQQAITALQTRDMELARSVVAEDEAINQHRLQIEAQCFAVMATQQPAARDLRTLIAILTIVIDLERMADHAKGIAKTVIRASGEPPFPPTLDIQRMADLVLGMLSRGLQAFAEWDAELARRVCASDDEIDHLYKQLFNVMLSYMFEDPRTITRATYLLWTAHNLERVADLVTNIGERVIYYQTGLMQELND